MMVRLSASNTNEMMPLNKGSTVALITPMTRTGDVHVDNLKNLLQYHLDAGTDNLCVLGTTGEASTLSMEERRLVLTTAVEMCKGRIPIMAGCGTINPVAVQEMTQQAIDVGCDANLLVTPYYVKPPQRGMIRMFCTIADMGLPVVLYNIPGRASVNLSDESIATCAQHESIVGLKDATGDLSRLESVRQLLLRSDERDFLLYSGDDNSSLEYVKRGGHGCISVTANVAAPAMHQIMKAALRGNFTEAETLNQPLLQLHKQLFCEPSPMPVKWAAQRIKLIDTDYCRPPLDTLDSAFMPQVEQALQAAGLI
jgi:4-hydroxy-tetrahydrodipicolinate synthase